MLPLAPNYTDEMRERSRFDPNTIAMLSMSRNQDAGQVNLDHDQIFARSSKSVCRVLIRSLPTSLNEDLGLTILSCGKQAVVHWPKFIVFDSPSRAAFIMHIAFCNRRSFWHPFPHILDAFTAALRICLITCAYINVSTKVTYHLCHYKLYHHLCHACEFCLCVL